MSSVLIILSSCARRRDRVLCAMTFARYRKLRLPKSHSTNLMEWNYHVVVFVFVFVLGLVIVLVIVRAGRK